MLTLIFGAWYWATYILRTLQGRDGLEGRIPPLGKLIDGLCLRSGHSRLAESDISFDEVRWNWTGYGYHDSHKP